MAQININSEAMKQWLQENNITAREVSERIGRSSGYMSKCIKEGHILDCAYRLLTDTYMLPYNMFIQPDEAPVPKAADNYAVSMAMAPGRIRFSITSDGNEIYYANAFIKGDTELDVMQAISYAAHLCYKFAQRDNLEVTDYEKK